jgi:2-oxoglutarate ferredoxin oxidoreductase subunit gamma
MQTEVIISGFGGQGVLFAGQALAYTALDQGRHVTWIPSYGPEMRGGTAHCTVIIADEEIGSPLVRNPSAAIVMNLPSMDRYEPLVCSSGTLIVNASLVDREPRRTDIQNIMVPANEIGEELGDRRLANTVLLGALLQTASLFTLEQLGESLSKHIAARHRDLLEANLKALKRGAAMARGEGLPVS